jgi:tRNA threonylcarbamoyladenosine biosynthesis protein TsaE
MFWFSNNLEMMNKDLSTTQYCQTPEDTFALGEKIGESLRGGEVVLLQGGLGAGKTLLTKGILSALGFDVDEVTSPSFTLVNLYHAKFDVYHIDFYRLNEGVDVAFAVGLEEILEEENAVVIIEWAERLGNFSLPDKSIKINIEGDGEEARKITIGNLTLPDNYTNIYPLPPKIN